MNDCGIRNHQTAVRFSDCDFVIDHHAAGNRLTLDRIDRNDRLEGRQATLTAGVLRRLRRNRIHRTGKRQLGTIHRVHVHRHGLTRLYGLYFVRRQFSRNNGVVQVGNDNQRLGTIGVLPFFSVQRGDNAVDRSRHRGIQNLLLQFKNACLNLAHLGLCGCSRALCCRETASRVRSIRRYHIGDGHNNCTAAVCTV